MDDRIRSLRDKLLPVLRKHGVKRAGVFGSVNRDDFDEAHSDIDVLVEFNKKKSLLGVIGVRQELAKAIGREVDLVEYHLIKPAIREQVLKHEKRLL
jgi:hypothetical protein